MMMLNKGEGDVGEVVSFDQEEERKGKERNVRNKMKLEASLNIQKG